MEPLGGSSGPDIAFKGLVIDDDEQWQDTFSRYLTDAGLKPKVVSSLKEAEELLDREFFHVALVDLSLFEDSNRDGLKLLRKICQEMREGTSAVLLTGYGGVEAGAEAKSYGAEVIEKSRVSYSRMREVIPRAMESAVKALAGYKVGFNLLGDPTAPGEREIHEYDMLHAMSCGYERADALASRLFDGLYPVLRLSQSPGAKVNTDRRMVYGTYWSKMLGAPCVMIMGDAENVTSEMKHFQSSPEDYAAKGYKEVIRFGQDENIAGVVIKTTTPEFASFDRRHDPQFQTS